MSRLSSLKWKLARHPVLIAILVVIVANIWFASFGSWTRWPMNTDYYDQLASAFAHGSLALEKKPDPAVLALANPYNPGKRAGVNIPIDFSLYNGKYYLYFGPVPALSIVAFKLLGAGVIGDQVLVFFFVTGIAIAQALLLMKLRELFFPAIPAWLVALCVVFAALICPFSWVLTEARVYEAAEAAAQFFFLLGCYFLLDALAKKPSPRAGLLLGGVSWMLSIGSRISQAVPIGLLTVLIGAALLWIHFRSRTLSKGIQRIVLFGLPFVVGFALIGWYNWARFGSVFNTGFTYEITRTNFQLHSGDIFSSAYILPNIYNYFAARPDVSGQFPYLQAVRGRGEDRFAFLQIPLIYYTRPVTAFEISVPFVFFAVLSLLPFLPFAKRSGGSTQQAGSAGLLKWTVAGLWIAYLAGVAVLASYFWVVTRFLVDCSAALVLLSVIGFWLGYQALGGRTWPRRAYAALGIALMLSSVVVSTLLMFSMHAMYYQGRNPALWNWLVQSFPHS